MFSLLKVDSPLTSLTSFLNLHNTAITGEGTSRRCFIFGEYIYANPVVETMSVRFKPRTRVQAGDSWYDVLRRLRVTPVKTSTLALSFSVSQFAFVLVGIFILFVIGKIFLDIQVLGSLVSFIGVILLGMITFFAIGSAVGSIVGSFRSANIIIWTAFTPMLMLSELFLPISILPAWLQPIAKALPLTPINTMLRDIVYGVPLEDLWRLGVLAGWIVIASIVTVRFFRWE